MPGDPHRHADVRQAQGRRVVDPVAGHRDDRPTPTPRLDDAQLLLRVHPRVDGDALDPGRERRVVEPVQLGAGEGLAARLQDPDPAGDRGAGERVVAGDHDRRDAGAPARGDGGGRRGAGRIGHRDEPGEAQVRLGLLGDLRDGVQLAVGEGEHAVAVGGESQGSRLGGSQEEAVSGIEQRGDGLERALGGDPDAVPVAVQRGHPAAGGVEGELLHARLFGEELGGEDTALAGEREEGALGRISGDRPGAARVVGGAKGRVVAGSGDRRDAVQGAVEGGGIDRSMRASVDRGVHADVGRGISSSLGLERAVGGVPIAGHPHSPHRRPCALDEHPVLGQRARLVRADDRHRSERLDRGELADEGVAARHPAGAEGEGDRDDRRQPLRDGRHGQADRDQEHVLRRFPAGDAGGEDEGTDDEGKNGQRLAQCREPVLEWRLASGVLLEQLGDPAQRGRHAGGEHQAGASPVDDGCAVERDVALVGEDTLGHVGKRLRDLLGGLGLAGQGGLVDAQRPGLAEAQVGGHDVAGVEPHEIARDELRGRDEQRLAVANDARGRARHRA